MSARTFALNRDYLWILTVFCLKAVALYYAMMVSPPEQTLGDLIGIFYVHTPAAWVTYLAFGVSVVCTALFLLRKDFMYDDLAQSSAVVGIFYGAATILTGSIWAHAVWGSYWNWDPRETATLIAELAYLGYFMLRLSISSPERRAYSSGIYNILAFLTVPFSYLSVHALFSLHPVVVTPSGFQMSAAILQALILNVIAETALYIYIVRCLYLTTQLAKITDRLEETNS